MSLSCDSEATTYRHICIARPTTLQHAEICIVPAALSEFIRAPVAKLQAGVSADRFGAAGHRPRLVHRADGFRGQKGGRYQ